MSVRASDFSIPSGYLKVDNTYYYLTRLPTDRNDFVGMLNAYNIPDIVFGSTDKYIFA